MTRWKLFLKVEIEFTRNQYDNILRNSALEELYERNGTALGMTFTTDEDVLKNESGLQQHLHILTVDVEVHCLTLHL